MGEFSNNKGCVMIANKDLHLRVNKDELINQAEAVLQIMKHLMIYFRKRLYLIYFLIMLFLFIGGGMEWLLGNCESTTFNFFFCRCLLADEESLGIEGVTGNQPSPGPAMPQKSSPPDMKMNRYLYSVSSGDANVYIGVMSAIPDSLHETSGSQIYSLPGHPEQENSLEHYKIKLYSVFESYYTYIRDAADDYKQREEIKRKQYGNR